MIDRGATISAGPGCMAGGNAASCEVAADAAPVVDLGDGNDTFETLVSDPRRTMIACDAGQDAVRDLVLAAKSAGCEWSLLTPAVWIGPKVRLGRHAATVALRNAGRHALTIRVSLSLRQGEGRLADARVRLRAGSCTQRVRLALTRLGRRGSAGSRVYAFAERGLSFGGSTVANSRWACTNACPHAHRELRPHSPRLTKNCAVASRYSHSCAR